MKATLILENGRTFVGESIGSTGDCVCQLVFNTSMVGYQEILTDPSCAGQGVVMTYPLIGNYGVNGEDNEADRPWAAAIVLRRISPRGSNFRNQGTLDDYLKENNIPGIQGIDTRELTRILRNEGTMNAMITCAEHFHMDEALAAVRAYRVTGRVEETGCKKITHIPGAAGAGRIALLDLGEKRSILERITGKGCDVTVFPPHTTAEEILGGGFDGVILSQGPGDPGENTDIVLQAKKLYDAAIPVLALGLGHQIMALATGAKVEKLPYGHRGSSVPVRDLATGRVRITAQNHGYTVVRESVDPSVAAVSWENVNDASVEGLTYTDRPVISIQFQPDTVPGTRGGGDHIDAFLTMACPAGKETV